MDRSDQGSCGVEAEGSMTQQPHLAVDALGAGVRDLIVDESMNASEVVATLEIHEDMVPSILLRFS